MKLAFGVICRDFDSISPYEEFLRNAAKHLFKIDNLIVVYEDQIDYDVVDHLSQYTKVLHYKPGSHSVILQQLKEFGLPEENIENILMNEIFDKYHFLPYGAHRNCVLIAALLNDIDYLLFFDTDTYPKILLNDSGEFMEVNWVKCHLDHLYKRYTVATSSDYTGYFIIPPIYNYDYLDDLLFCVQKNPEYYKSILPQNCIVVESNNTNPSPTSKLLGGNLGFSLKELLNIPPFHSTFHFLEDEFIMSRGEDTMMGTAIFNHHSYEAMDIKTRIFHDTFDNFPEKPDVVKIENTKRFYRACVGWIGRNPLYNWYLYKLRMCEETPFYVFHKQKEKIDAVAQSAAEHFKYEKFLNLPVALEQAFSMLNVNIKIFMDVDQSWQVFLRRVIL